MPVKTADAERNVALYPWFRFLLNLLFWQAVWFLYFQAELSAAEAVLLYTVFDVAATVLEVPSGYMSDRLGRRLTLVASALAGTLGAVLLAVGDGFAAFASGQVLWGASIAFASGTDSALLYESLAVTGRQDEIEQQELRAWRFSFVALALAAVTGGVLGHADMILPFAAASIAFLGATFLALRFTEPAHLRGPEEQGAGLTQLGVLRAAFAQPVLRWLFVLSLLMYGFSHVPFVFGQPFILQAMDRVGLAAQAPVISGIVSALMMLVSVGASLLAPGVRRALGLAGVLLLALGMQVALIGALALSGSAFVIALLMLRMVPNALSRPFILARIQPLLGDAGRATYLSLQSLCGRLVFAASLVLASFFSSDVGGMSYTEIRLVLAGYAVSGLVALVLLARGTRRVLGDGAGSA